MDDLLAYLVKLIVENPNEVEVLTDESQLDDSNITLIIDSNPDDVPLIIGRNGTTIKALRSITSIIAVKEDKHVSLKAKHQKPREENLEEPANIVSEAPVEDETTEESETEDKSKSSAVKATEEDIKDTLGF